MRTSKKQQKFWLVLVLIAMVALILTSILPLLRFL